MNYYEVLQVSEKAELSVISAAYKLLMRSCHPDKFPGDAAAAEKATQVNRAFEMLKDPQSRRAFDLQLAAERAAAYRPDLNRSDLRPDQFPDAYPNAYPDPQRVVMDAAVGMAPVIEAFVDGLADQAVEYALSQLPPPLREVYRRARAARKGRG